MASVKDKERIKGVSAVSSAPGLPAVSDDRGTAPEVVTGEVIDWESLIDEGLREYQIKRGIEDFTNAPQNVWDGGLMYIYKYYIKPNEQYLWVNDTRYSDGYNINVIYDVCKYYIALCMINNRQVSINGFSHLTGINNNIITDWGNSRIKKATTKHVEIYKSLLQENEQSLSNRLYDGKQNPVGVIAILNNIFGWNTSRVAHDTATGSADNTAIAAQMGLAIEKKS